MIAPTLATAFMTAVMAWRYYVCRTIPREDIAGTEWEWEYDWAWYDWTYCAIIAGFWLTIAWRACSG